MAGVAAASLSGLGIAAPGRALAQGGGLIISPARGEGPWPPPATLMAFDLLHLDGRSTRALPYAERRSLLDQLHLDGPLCRTPERFVGQAEELLAATAQHGLEGVVAKRLSSRYEPGRRTGA